jgi:hypothetical protein
MTKSKRATTRTAAHVRGSAINVEALVVGSFIDELEYTIRRGMRTREGLQPDLDLVLRARGQLAACQEGAPLALSMIMLMVPDERARRARILGALKTYVGKKNRENRNAELIEQAAALSAKHPNLSTVQIAEKLEKTCRLTKRSIRRIIGNATSGTRVV